MYLLITLAALAGSPETPDVGPLVRALWLVQRYGTPEGLDPKNDQRVKAALAKALANEGAITLGELGGFMQPDIFNKLAGPDGTLDSADTTTALGAARPESRTKLAPKLRAHADYLATTFDLIDPMHREAGEKLARWIAANYEPGKPLHVTVVCTGNSRRSILGSSMGNLAAAYYGMPEIRFHSGGTAPTAFNPRTAATLKAVGFEVEPTGKEAPRGEPKTKNPVYRVAWGEGFESLEFSKHYADASNPQRGFAALMVCSEADESCPLVKGATLRLSMPYLDPKIYDGGAYESAKYAERRDDLGRLMLAVMVQARGSWPRNSRTHGEGPGRKGASSQRARLGAINRGGDTPGPRPVGLASPARRRRCSDGRPPGYRSGCGAAGANRLERITMGESTPQARSESTPPGPPFVRGGKEGGSLVFFPPLTKGGLGGFCGRGLPVCASQA